MMGNGKNVRRRDKIARFVLFLQFYVVIFAGMCLLGFIYGLTDGMVQTRITELPYLAYAIVSVLLTGILFVLIFRKRKKR